MGQRKMAERLLARIWKRQLVLAEKLLIDSGERVRVIHPGRENSDRGPDFVGAMIATSEGRLMRGDIELHLKGSDWRSHGHHRDPTYNAVILHIVWDGGKEVVLQSGRTVPTLSLRRCLSGSLDEVRDWSNLPVVPTEPCHNAGRRPRSDELVQLLDEAGDERFRLKAGRFASSLDDEPPSQALYQGIMGALGYSKNKKPFEELSRRLRLGVLEGCCRGKPYWERVVALRALLLGTAGLLPGDNNGQQERLWRYLGGEETMSSACWRLFRVRPDNHPVPRLSGAAHLLVRFGDGGGLLESVLQLINESGPGADRLEAGFVVHAAEPCFGKKRTLVGQGRAREIVVNIALPFIFAWAEATAQRRLAEQVLALYRSYPKTCENGLTRELTTLLLDSNTLGLVDSARRQQGLIHLAKTFCHQRRCGDCPVSKRLNTVALAC
ncbi:MAG: DUF2851 family protein [Dehalococcoidia bacterium]